MSKPDLTEVLSQYAETCGLEPSEDEELYDELEMIAMDAMERIDDIARKAQEAQS